MTPGEVVARLRSIGGSMDIAIGQIEHNGDLLDLDWAVLDDWITDLRRIQCAVDADGRQVAGAGDLEETRKEPPKTP